MANETGTEWGDSETANNQAGKRRLCEAQRSMGRAIAVVVIRVVKTVASAKKQGCHYKNASQY